MNVVMYGPNCVTTDVLVSNANAALIAGRRGRIERGAEAITKATTKAAGITTKRIAGCRRRLAHSIH